jgi:hypothetical protein
MLDAAFISGGSRAFCPLPNVPSANTGGFYLLPFNISVTPPEPVLVQLSATARHDRTVVVAGILELVT